MLYGLDIGGTKIELAIFDSELTLQTSWRVATPGQDYRQFLATITDMVNEADQKTQQQGTVGLCFPGIVDSNGCMHAANIPAINGQPLAADTLNKLGRPVVFENDAKAFVLSEVNGGAAHGAKNALAVIVGTGIAGGFCVDGQLYHGKQNIACEYGHIPLPALLQQRYKLPLRQCGCGLTSCIETYLSGPGLLWLCAHFGSDYASVPALIQGVQSKQADALDILAAYIDCLACYLAQLILMYDPDTIVLGGGLSNIAELYPPLPAAIGNYLFAGVTQPVIVAPVFGDSSGVRGAALLGQRAAAADKGPGG